MKNKKEPRYILVIEELRPLFGKKDKPKCFKVDNSDIIHVFFPIDQTKSHPKRRAVTYN